MDNLRIRSLIGQSNTSSGASSLPCRVWGGWASVRVPEILIGVLVLGLVALAAICIRIGLPDARPSALRAGCADNLRRIGLALSAYVAFHGDVPRDERGVFGIRELEEALRAVSSAGSLECPARPGQTGYRVRSVSLAEIKRGAHVPVVYDCCANHQVLGREIWVNVLLANWQVRLVVIKQQEIQARDASEAAIQTDLYEELICERVKETAAPP